MSRVDNISSSGVSRTPPPVVQRQRLSSTRLVPFDLVGVLAALTDFIVIFGSCILSARLYHELILEADAPVERFATLGCFVFANFVVIQASRHNYRPQQLFDVRRQVRAVTMVWVLTFALVLAAAFSFKLTTAYSRGATLVFFASGWMGLVISRRFFAVFLERALSQGSFLRKQVVVITDSSQLNTSAITRNLEQCGYAPYKIVELNLSDGRNLIEGRNTVPSHALPEAVFGDLVAISRKVDINRIFLQIPWSKRRAIDEIMTQLRALSVPVHLLPDDNVAHFLDHHVVPIGLGWTAELKRAPLSRAEQFGKRLIDITLSGAILLMLTPLLVLVALAIKLDGSGSVFFRQTRQGFNGRPFKIFKFRTMNVTEDDVVRQATRNDPRVTRIGSVLRRTNIDELPQLLNVLSGEMSLVGPRPHATSHNAEYEKLISNYAFRYHMRPGITGWAQIQGLRGETKTLDRMVERVDADLWYVNNWSFLLDLKILLRTLLIGIQPTAY